MHVWDKRMLIGVVMLGIGTSIVIQQRKAQGKETKLLGLDAPNTKGFALVLTGMALAVLAYDALKGKKAGA